MLLDKWIPSAQSIGSLIIIGFACYAFVVEGKPVQEIVILINGLAVVLKFLGGTKTDG